VSFPSVPVQQTGPAYDGRTGGIGGPGGLGMGLGAQNKMMSLPPQALGSGRGMGYKVYIYISLCI
jgi:hypothetical protein